ncbi:hypothetical protein DP23_3900 [Ralstonia pickettii]|nr:hypothetical protein DP23_3900 [Ralstonia pickettii]
MNPEATAEAHRTLPRKTARHRKTQVAPAANWWAVPTVWRALTMHGHRHARGG